MRDHDRLGGVGTRGHGDLHRRSERGVELGEHVGCRAVDERGDRTAGPGAEVTNADSWPGASTVVVVAAGVKSSMFRSPMRL